MLFLFRLLWISILLLSSANVTLTADATLPNHDIPKVKQQIEMYQQAYAPYQKQPQFDHQSTPIVGLGRMMEVAYSHVRKSFSENDERFGLLASFWEEDKGLIDGMTIGKFFAVNIRLAFLLSEGMPISLTEDTPEIAYLREKQRWRNLENFSDSTHCPELAELINPVEKLFPFTAILYNSSGVISINHFLDSYYDADLMMHLAALPRNPGSHGPHNGDYPNSVTYLIHDLFHKRRFHRAMRDKQECVEQFKSQRTLGRALRQQEKNKHPLFMLSHEFTYFDLGSENDAIHNQIDEVLPPRDLPLLQDTNPFEVAFRRWVGWSILEVKGNIYDLVEKNLTYKLTDFLYKETRKRQIDCSQLLLTNLDFSIQVSPPNDLYIIFSLKNFLHFSVNVTSTLAFESAEENMELVKFLKLQKVIHRQETPSRQLYKGGK